MSIGCGVDSKFMIGLLLGFRPAPIGNTENESGAAARCGLQPNAAAMAFGNFLADGQTDAGARILCLGMQALKNHEDALAMFGSYTNAIVTHGNVPTGRRLFRADVNDCGAVAAEFDSVSNEVLHDL